MAIYSILSVHAVRYFSAVISELMRDCKVQEILDSTVDSRYITNSQYNKVIFLVPKLKISLYFIVFQPGYSKISI